MRASEHSGSIRWTAYYAFLLGSFGASAYLLFGGDFLLWAPRWAYVVFFPGFVAGGNAHDLGMADDAAKLIGIAAVGLTYAGLGALAHSLWLALHRPSPPAQITSR